MTFDEARAVFIEEAMTGNALSSDYQRAHDVLADALRDVGRPIHGAYVRAETIPQFSTRVLALLAEHFPYGVEDDV